MKDIDQYEDGISMQQFKHIAEISCYNHNYYVGFRNNLLFGNSDDDSTTQWWLINGSTSVFLGESHINDEILHRYDKRNT